MSEFDNHDRWPSQYADAESPTLLEEKENEGNLDAIIQTQVWKLIKKGIVTEADGDMAYEYIKRARAIKDYAWAIYQSDMRMTNIMNAVLNSES